MSGEEAARRLAQQGYNELPAAARASPLWRALGVLREPMFALLLGAAVVYALIGEPLDAAVLLGFATLSVSIAIIQRGRSERALAALKDLSSPRALVLRDGERRRIPGREVVVGDLLVVGEGDRVPADALLREGDDLLADESLLTGESVPVRKRPAVEQDDPRGSPGGDDLPQIYSGTLLVRGSGLAEVVATGAATQMGRIGTELEAIRSVPVGLQAETRRLVLSFAAVGLGFSLAAVGLHGLLTGRWLEATLAGIALGMAMLPEEFPLVLTVFTVMGAWRLSQARVLTRQPSAIETLGAATVLCTDKTGTLTRNQMVVERLETTDRGASWSRGEGAVASGASVGRLLETAALACAPQSVDPMDRAVLELAAAAGMTTPSPEALVRTWPLRPEHPAIVLAWRERGSEARAQIAAKGAPEAVSRLCGLPAAASTAMNEQVDALASEGIRVLAVASARHPADALPDDDTGLAFEYLGLVGFIDPLRETVPAAMAACRSAGVRVVMITGDHPRTAAAIAASAGIPGTRTLTGTQLEALDAAGLAERVRDVDVFARIRPEQKLRIVEALKTDGQVVAMTGDGVNDAPALKAAHIGIAMGGRGTDVAREAADLVLLDDDFGSIVDAVRLGRRIYDNLGKAMGYILAVHVPIAGTALLPSLLGAPLILTPMLIALLELLIDPACSVIFEAEPEEREAMSRPPRDPARRLVSRTLVLRSVTLGAIAFAAVAAAYFWAEGRAAGTEATRSMTVLVLVLANLLLVLVQHRMGGPGRRLNVALLWGLAAAAAVVTTLFAWPLTRGLLGLAPLGGSELLVGAGIAVLAGAAMMLTARLMHPRR